VLGCIAFVFLCNPIYFGFHSYPASIPVRRASGFERPSGHPAESHRPSYRVATYRTITVRHRKPPYSLSGHCRCSIRHRMRHVLTLSPTRELAEQTQKVVCAWGDFMNVQCHACIGWQEHWEISAGWIFLECRLCRARLAYDMIRETQSADQNS
jgi:hypothetical protein